jgi:hypothetical protein
LAQKLVLVGELMPFQVGVGRENFFAHFTGRHFLRHSSCCWSCICARAYNMQCTILRAARASAIITYTRTRTRDCQFALAYACILYCASAHSYSSAGYNIMKRKGEPHAPWIQMVSRVIASIQDFKYVIRCI